MGKIGLLGGTFDPIHYAHLFMGQLCKESLGLDKVIYIPAGIVSHKNSVYTDAKMRYEMVKLAIEGNSCFEVSDYEITKSTPSYSDETVAYFKNMYPNDEIVFIFGEDSLDYVETWHNAAELLSMCTFAVVGRGGFELDIESKIDFLKEKFGAKIEYIKSPEFDVSSRVIRDMISNGKSVKRLVSDNVLNFIEKNNLYRNIK